MAENEDVKSLYFYNPSLAAAILFAVLYLVLGCVHGYYCFYLSCQRPRHLRHRYMICFWVSAAISAVGFSTRIGSLKRPEDVGLYASSATWIVISPIFVCAALYLLLARLVARCLGTGSGDDAGDVNNPNRQQNQGKQRLLGIPAKWLGRIFVTSDVVSFLTQGAGSGIASSGNWEGNMKDIGVNVLLFGLAMQLATFTLFLVLMWVFVTKNRDINGRFERKERLVVLGMWIAGVCVECRSIYRVVEFGLGIEGYPFNHEWLLYVLEALPMFIAIGTMAWCHPVRLLDDAKKEKHENAAGVSKA